MMNKANPKEHLDEMQIQIRNKVGNQCFFIVFYLIMIDLGLKDYGVKWAASPISLYAIILLCMGYYLVRIICAGAYIGQSKKNATLIIVLLAAMIITIASILIIIRVNILRVSFNISYTGVLISFLFSFIMIIVVFRIISRNKNNKGND